MAEACGERLWNSIPRFYVCLNVLYTLVQGGSEVACSMQKWGVTYMGSRNVTKNGKTCQAWATETPHPVNKDIKDESFPDASKEDAENFCRNPYAEERYGVWCYTVDSNDEWEYCDVCPGTYEKYPGCTLPDKGGEYNGVIDHSQSHMECEPWSSHKSSHYKFPDGSEENAKNYCRNPDPKNYEGPWCFIKGMPGITWDYCDICKPFQGELKVKFGSYNKGAVRIDDMNRLACIHWCIKWASCVAVNIPHGEKGSQCWFLTDLTGTLKEDSRWDQYEILRICNPHARETGGHFVELPKYPSQGGVYLSEGSVEVCDKACIAKPDCVMYDRYPGVGTCKSHYNIKDRYFRKSEATARYIIRCNPSLKPAVAVSVDITDNPTETPAPSELSALSEPVPQPSEEPLTEMTLPSDQPSAGVSAESVETSDEPKEKKGLPMVAIVGGAIAVIAVVGGGYAYYTLVYKKGKKDSKNGASKGERKQLTSRRLPKRQKDSKGKDSKRKK